MKELTDKAKDNFFEWLQTEIEKEDEYRYTIIRDNVYWWFEDLPQSAQFGLIQEWAEHVLFIALFLKWIEDFVLYYKLHNFDLPLTQIEAVKKLSEIYNK